WRGHNLFQVARTWFRTGFHSTVNDHFCGFGPGVTCSRRVAGLHADALGIEDERDRRAFLRRYYLMRFMRVYANANAWWRLRSRPWSVGVLTGRRLNYYLPGSFFEDGPYPHGLYAQRFPDGEPGLSVVPQLGLLVDERDLVAA